MRDRSRSSQRRWTLQMSPPLYLPALTLYVLLHLFRLGIQPTTKPTSPPATQTKTPPTILPSTPPTSPCTTTPTLQAPAPTTQQTNLPTILLFILLASPLRSHPHTPRLAKSKAGLPILYLARKVPLIQTGNGQRTQFGQPATGTTAKGASAKHTFVGGGRNCTPSLLLRYLDDAECASFWICTHMSCTALWDCLGVGYSEQQFEASVMLLSCCAVVFCSCPKQRIVSRTFRCGRDHAFRTGRHPASELRNESRRRRECEGEGVLNFSLFNACGLCDKFLRSRPCSTSSAAYVTNFTIP
mmetsp:Transcript_31694/g.69300  ORF Transcript_31694/g.69300 Transcript_31694/m.69300 type:complete len:299 (+) Transcript_31694:2255-3151(+)